MKIALLGYGKEGKAAETFFKNQDAEITIFQDFDPKTLDTKDFAGFDLVFRSPSVSPLANLPSLTSVTRYFFEHCPCPIIGVTATKGKGTTCSFIKSLLDELNEDVHLVGNIGEPAINVLGKLTKNSVVVYEMSSFQLWDLEIPPHIAVIGTIEPDHLNIHKDYADYLAAKGNICKNQTVEDYTIFYKDNREAVTLAEKSSGKKVAFPYNAPADVLASVKLAGQHNKNNALAAIAAVASYYRKTPAEFIKENIYRVKAGLEKCKGLPHRLEFLRTVNGVRYFDDNFATNTSSTRVAVDAFPNSKLFMIVGGRDKTGNTDFPEIIEILNSPNIEQCVLIGESGHALFESYRDLRFVLADSLEDAVEEAKIAAETYRKNHPGEDVVVLMSPSAASFDMFENVYDRGAKYQEIVKNLIEEKS